MNGRSAAALILVAFIGGAAGFAWLSSDATMPWESPQLAVLPAEPESTPLLAPPGATPVQPSASQAEALLLVLSARRAVEAGKPLGNLGSRLQASFGQSQPQALATIAQAARNPLSNGELLAGFDAVAPQLAEPVGTMWNRVRYELGSLFVIRSTETKPTAVQARIASIRQAILAGEIAEAARLVRALPGAANAKDWLAQANRAIAVEQAFDMLDGAALAVAKPAAPLANTQVTPEPGGAAGDQSLPAGGE